MAATASTAECALARLRIRRGAPRTDMPTVGYVEAGSVFQPIERVVGEVVHGNATWLRLPDDRYVWSGASTPVRAPERGGAPMHVSYRRDLPGAIAVLSDAERDHVFGAIGHYREARTRGAIVLDASWKDRLAEIETPIFAHLGRASITVHELAAAPFRAVFGKIVAAGLDDIILRYDGCFVPRHKGWDPTRGLSSHSWGIAIDLNARWNGYGNAPAPLGAIGCVRELVPIFASEGFAWGGYFTPDGLRDGMHFELARRDLPRP